MLLLKVTSDNMDQGRKSAEEAAQYVQCHYFI
jgi:hypothetical protein